MLKDLNINWDEIEEAKDFERVAPGGYVCRITFAEDVEDKEYWRIEYDVAEGDFKDYYHNLYASKGFWGGSFVKSYKAKARSFFKSFVTALQESNPGFRFDNDEQKVKGKLIGLVLAEEEYEKNDGSVGTRLYVFQPRSVQAIRKGDFKVPEKKLLKKADEFTPFQDDGKLPF